MAQSIQVFELETVDFAGFDQIKHFFLDQWTRLHQMPNVFKYKLNVTQQKIVPGDFKFLVQLNEDRTAKRRKPQKIDSITPAFNEDTFNFTKVDDSEYILNVVYKPKSMTVSFLINQSPLTPYHALICPNLMDKLPQILTRDSIEFAMRLLLAMGERKFRIGYNSPGALASVNHLHLHLISIEEELYVESAALEHLTNNVYVLGDKYPAKGYCFPLFAKTQIDVVANDVFTLIQFLNECQKAHNVFFTFGTMAVMAMAGTQGTTAAAPALETSPLTCLPTESDKNNLKIFVLPRDKCCLNKKIFCNLNVAFCEICGYVPVGDKETYDEITEDFIVTEIKSNLGNVVDDLKDRVISEYCKYQHQIKPFSHIIMDLFNEVVNFRGHDLIPQKYDNKFKSFLDGQKSDTDSGRSSEHEVTKLKAKTPPKPPRKSHNGQNYCVKPPPTTATTQTTNNTGGLKVRRMLNNEELPSPIYPINTKPTDVEQEQQEARAKQLQVNRRKRDQIRKRHDYRRNTIDIAQFDLNLGRRAGEDRLNTSLSKSASNLTSNEIQENQFNKRIDEMGIKCTSMPKGFFETLRIRRQSSCKEVPAVVTDTKVIATGPEFFLNAGEPAKLIDITTPKCTQQRSVHILLLSGKRLQIRCDPTTTLARHIFEAVIKSENISENFFIGLCALIGGDFVFLPMDLKVYKVAPQLWVNVTKKGNAEVPNETTFTLFLRVKFFLPTLRGVSSLESRHLLYLQLRKSVLERQILCTDEDMIALCALALQAEVGDFDANMKHVEYFTISHYLPDGVYQRNKELARYLRNAHYLKRGLHRTEAEQNFIRYLQELKEYGLHLYSAIWETSENQQLNVYVGISLSGVLLFERNLKNLFTTPPDDNNGTSKKVYQRNVYAHFEWLEIENLCHTKNSLTIVVRRNESLSAKDKSRVKYKLKMDGRKSYFAFTLASEHHKFYMKLRNSFVSIKALSEELNIPLNVPPKNNPKKTEVKDHVDPVTDQISHKSVDKIDKLVKISGLRVRNLKKSMLNDGRLMKLREKFLRRSKSSVSDLNTIGRGPSMPNLSNEDQHRSMHKSEIQLHSKEESQNKENEHPRSCVPESPKPNNSTMQRNKVKMGTRVISSQLLNRSYDNIFDDPFERSASGQQSMCQKGEDSFIEMKKCARLEQDSLKSLSLESIYNTLEKSRGPLAETPLLPHAYVVHSSIRSSGNTELNTSFTLQHDETVSESLLEKFNNLSYDANDRILKRVIVIKETTTAKTDDKFCQSASTLMINMKNSLLSRSQECVANKSYKLRLPPTTAMGGGVRTTSNGPSSPRSMMVLKNVCESITARGGGDDMLKCERVNDGYTLGISIVQGTDNNVYVKDMVPNGPGDKGGIMIGDQIIAVDGVSLVNLSYADALKLLQSTGRIVELVLSQVYQPSRPTGTPVKKPSPTKAKSIQNIFNQSLNDINIEFDQIDRAVKNMNLYDGQYYRNADAGRHYQAEIVNFMKQLQDQERDGGLSLSNQNLAMTPRVAESENFKLTPSKSMPDLPKIVAIIPKDVKKTTLPRNMGGQSRKYTGPTRFPVTPCKEIIKTRSLLLLPSPSSTPSLSNRHQLSLLADSNEDETFFI